MTDDTQFGILNSFRVDADAGVLIIYISILVLDEDLLSSKFFAVEMKLYLLEGNIVELLRVQYSFNPTLEVCITHYCSKIICISI